MNLTIAYSFCIILFLDTTETNFKQCISTKMHNNILLRTGIVCESENIAQGRSYYNVSIDISHCFFSRTSQFSGDGGVICVDVGSLSMNMNYSMFCSCFASSYGAINFRSSNSCLKMICANKCNASNNYHFAYFRTSQINHVEYLSVSNCSYSTYQYWSTYLQYGDQKFVNTNSSMNNAYQGSGICFFSPSSFTNTYCTFSNNKVSFGVCINFYSTSGTITMSYANIVHNNSPHQGVVQNQETGIRKMMYCIFYNNLGVLFYVNAGSLEVSHSFIDHSSTFSALTSVSTPTNNSFINRMTYHIQFFNSLHCNTDIPDRTINQTPIKSLANTLRITPEKTTEQTIRITPRITPINSVSDTMRETPELTFPRTYVECIFTCQMANRIEMRVVFSFSLMFLMYIK